MMAKIVQGRGFKGVINYVLDKNKAEVIGANGLRLSTKDLVVRSFITQNMAKMGYNNTQFLIARHNDTDHPHLHLILNRVDSDGKRISDQNERIRSTQVCKELTIRHGLYFAKGKENAIAYGNRIRQKTRFMMRLN